ncbi:MAG: large conductance mechanosensitive channel protein MscL [Solobacterium sp.]|nr:large conductance mechanosensitive channel protein MscL [Solobacterium sp.]
MKKFLEEFKAFALKGNVMDMSIGVIVGASFGNIVSSLTNNFINPLIQLCTGGINEEGVQIGGSFKILGVSFNYGQFLSDVINFLIMAFILFCVIKAINAAMKIGKKEEEEEAPKEDPEDIKLLKEMLAIMKEQNPEAAKAAEAKLAQE